MSLATAVEYRLSIEDRRRESRNNGSWINFFRHFGEMVVAMIAGMAVLGGLVAAAGTVLGQGDALDQLWVRAPVMATNMTIGMAVWMLFRGHGWRQVTAMSATMFAPLAALAVPYGAGVLSGDALLGWMHMLMLPAMLAVMLARRNEYAIAHNHHGGPTRLSPNG